jgi:SAM-dependent methyltransferase
MDDKVMVKSRYIIKNDPTIDSVGRHKLPVKSRWSRPYEYEFAMRWAKSGLRMVDAASGGGTHPFCHHLADVSPGLVIAVDQARWSVGEMTPGLEYHQTSMTEMPLEDNSIDIVFSISVIEHCTDEVIRNFFAEAARVLKTGGLFIITQNTGSVYPGKTPSWSSRELDATGFVYEQLTKSDDIPDGAITEYQPPRWCYRWICEKG